MWLQIEFGQTLACGLIHPQAMLQIWLHTAMVTVYRLQCGLQKIRLHAPDYVQNLLGR